MQIFLIANNAKIPNDIFTYINELEEEKIIVQFNHMQHIDKIDANYLFIRKDIFIKKNKINDKTIIFTFDDDKTLENYSKKYKPTIGFIALNYFLQNNKNNKNNKITLVGFTLYELQESFVHDLHYEKNFIDQLVKNNTIKII